MSMETVRVLSTLKALIRENFDKRTHGLVAVVGTSCSGKTGVLKELEEWHDPENDPDIDFLTAHEAFGSLYGKGMPLPDRQDEDQVRLAQYAAMLQQLVMENAVFRESQAEVDLVCGRMRLYPVVDRTIVDLAQYLPGGLRELEEVIGVRSGILMGRYALIVRLEHPTEEIYDEAWERNPTRRPKDYSRILKQADRLDELYREALGDAELVEVDPPYDSCTIFNAPVLCRAATENGHQGWARKVQEVCRCILDHGYPG